MSVWTIIPTCGDPMSCYTLVALCLLFTGNAGIITMLFRWTNKELKFVRNALTTHDDYINDTTKQLNQMSIDIAVTQKITENINGDTADIKRSIENINRIIMEKFTK